MKKSIVYIILIVFIFSCTTLFVSAATLRNPQGRIGTGYKPERYNSFFKTNINAYELGRIGDIIKQEEQQEKLYKKKEQERIKQEKYNALKLQQEKEDKIRAQVKLTKEKTKLQEQTQKEQEFELAKQEKLKIKEEKQHLALIKKQEQEKFKQEKAEELERQKLKEEQIRLQVRDIKNKNEITENNEKKQERELARQEKLKEKEEKKRLDLEKKFEENRIKQEQIALEQQEEQTANKKTFTFNLKRKKEQEEIQSEKNIAKIHFFKKLTNPEKNVDNEKIKEENKEKTQEAVNEVKQDKLYQDPQTKQIVKEISNELIQAKPEMLEELSALWVSAVQKSDTVYFAIMKLSNPNGTEVNKNGFKKILEPILSAAPLVGQVFVNPALSAGSFIGSSVMGTMMDDSAKKRLSKVNDADLVILARAIDELQKTLLINYMAYKNSLKEYELAIKITNERRKSYEELNKRNSPHVILANTFYAEALDNQYKARQEFLMKRVVLEQMVGAEALNSIEQKEIDKNTIKTNSNNQTKK